MRMCDSCHRVSGTYQLMGTDYICRHCVSPSNQSGCLLFETGRENPMDSKGTTAHVRDIKDRRWHPQEKRMFYYSKELGRTYFFPK